MRSLCAELTAIDQARLIIPIVSRNEYQTALRNLSREGRCDLYVRTLAYAWRRTSTDAERIGVRPEFP